VNVSQLSSAQATSAHFLLIEDDAQLRVPLMNHLQRRGFQVTACERGDTGLALAESQRFDLVLLDIMLPGLDGLGLLARLREQQGIPVILMSALGAEQDRITGFTQGADDYLPKPFSLAELDARIGALLRRVALDRRNTPVAAPVTSGPLSFDPVQQDVFSAAGKAGLTPSEYRLLETFQEHAGQPLSKVFLYQHVLHRNYTRLDRGLDVHVCNVRRKLAAIDVHELQIQAVRNQGYVLVWASRG
jgi:two-component system response regulator PfeR